MDLENIKKRNPKIYLIAGKARNGKDTLASFIREKYEEKGLKTVNVQVSTYIKMYAEKYFGWDGKEETKPRELLQVLGTEVIREKIDPLFHINRVCEDIKVLSYFYDVITISDIRAPEEITIPKEKFSRVKVIKITRVDFEEKMKNRSHYTETALDNFNDYDYKIENTTLEKLRLAANYIVEEEEKKDGNKS